MCDQVGAAFQRGPIGGGGVAAAAPTATASSSHIDVGAAGHHLPPDRWHEAGAPLTAAPATVTARGCCLRRCLCDPPSCPSGDRRRCCIGDKDGGRLPPPQSLTAWTNLLLHRSSSSRLSFIRASVLVCNVVVGERVNRTNLTLSRDLCCLGMYLCNFAKLFV